MQASKNKKIRKASKLLLLFVLLFIIPMVTSKEYYIPLLAVKETENGFIGSNANLFLELKKGSGRVFLDTYPLTKLDTQMSTRFAKEVACQKSNVDCTKFDFIYRIESSSVIIGGPSAGAAISLLTIISLENQKMNKDITITGTINSGGLVGTVGGLKQKIDAAHDIGLKIVLIPLGERKYEINELLKESYVINKTHNSSTIDLIEYGKYLGIEVREVGTIDEALFYLTGKEPKKKNQTLLISKSYLDTMKIVMQNLCKQSEKFENALSKVDLSKNDQLIYNQAKNISSKRHKAIKKIEYYAAASYCFGANTKFSYLTIKQKNLTDSEIADKTAKVRLHLKKTNQIIDKKKINTITDLQTYMIVKERLIEAKKNIDNSIDAKNTSDKLFYLSYGIERINSAVSWSNFFGKGTKKYIISEDELRKSCMNKILEAEERFEYIKLLALVEQSSTRTQIELARQDLFDEEYELCLFKASKAKANSDLILSTMTADPNELKTLAKQKLDVIKNNIIEGEKKGIFPLIGYSYYEYSKDLLDDNIYSSLLFAEYSLELSNLDIYFKEKKQINLDVINFIDNNIEFFLIFILGMIIGFSIAKIIPK